MSTMNISLPDEMKDFVDEQVAERGYGTSSEFVRDLIRKEQDRRQLRRLVLDGAASPRTGIADEKYFDSLRARARGGVGRRPATEKAKNTSSRKT